MKTQQAKKKRTSFGAYNSILKRQFRLPLFLCVIFSADKYTDYKGVREVMHISQIIFGVLIPFFGTAIGAAVVFFLRKDISRAFSDVLSAFAAGIMVAASVWSLIIPAIECSENLGKSAFIPATAGFVAGNIFMAVLDIFNQKILSGNKKMKTLTTTAIAVTIHNFPEGMAVGTIYGACLAGEESATLAAAFILSLGIAVQNIPEGAIISMPLKARGMSAIKAFLCGTLSGIVEPLGAFLTICAMGTATVLLPYLLSFAAGTMMFVVTQQLIPEIEDFGRVPIRALPFAAGFVLMMSLDVALS